MWFKISSYLKFILKSTNQHGVHSPFVYNFLTNCLYKKNSVEAFSKIENIRKSLLSNNNIIEITDFGKGSKIFKSNKRKIADIAKIAGISPKKSKLLLKIVSYFNFESVLEIGTSVGLGTATLSIANAHAKIITLEGCKNTAAVSKSVFNTFELKNIDVVIGNFKNSLPQILKNNSFDCIFFDGNHQKQPTLNYFNWCLNSIKNNTVFIFDDIYWSSEMLSAWNIIKSNPKVTVSIDTYYFGIVFFRKEQQKEHFTIRV